ncbi:MAG: thiamine phosphate synthase [Verrucomicrobia bacterium]|nr:MAG: thiamine phosphate synthase [Verrucomicrobiota bacterium]
MRALSDCQLYGILDLSYVVASDIARVAETLVQGDVDLIQLRGKKTSLDQLVDLARGLHQITSQASIPLIVNDHAEVAREVPVEGVHVGQEDDSIAVARAKVGRPILVGKSTHGLEQARAAQSEGADYIGFGPIFPTPANPDYTPIGLADIGQVHADVSLPIFCIGGIKMDNLVPLIAAGARRVAIVSGLLKAPDIANYARDVKRMLNSSFVIRHSSF